MNARILLDSFDLLGDELETIQKLRKLIVVLAVTGKLTSKSETVVDPITMMSIIKDRTQALSQRRQLRKISSESRVVSDDLPMGFLSPDNSFRLGTVARIEKGPTGIMKAQAGPYPLVVTAEERLSCDHFDFEGAAAIIPLVSSAGHGRASLQRLHYQEGKFALGSILAAVFPYEPKLITARFLFEYLTAFKEELLVSQMIGTANVSLSIGKLSDIPVPLVSPSVQRKVDELMSLCDQLDAAKADREKCRDSLVAASLQGLNEPSEDEETFREHARFTFNNLPRITTRRVHIKQLRQTILNLAVRGKLVPQDPSDEPARQWMSSFRAGQSGKRPRSGVTRKETPVDNFQAGYRLPATWLWVELGKILVTMDSGWSPQCENHARKDQSCWGVLKTTSVQPLAYDCRQNKELPAKFEARPQHEAIDGDILITRAGPKNRVGVSCVVHHTEPRLMISDKLIRFRLAEGLSPFFYAIALNAGITSMAIEEAKSGMAVMQMNITQNKLRSVPVPLPPLAEQHRIVAMVNELMAICDQLESQIIATEQDSRSFLESVLAAALAPDGEFEAEALVA